jgi:hypothetical protein
MLRSLVLPLPFLLATTNVAWADDRATPAPAADEGHAASPGRPHRGVFFSVDGGLAFQNLFSVAIVGADITGIVGGDLGDFDVGAILDVNPGSTEDGLGTLAVSIAPIVDGHIGIVRCGGGFRLGYFSVTRATGAARLESPLVGLFIRTTIDVLQWGDASSLYLAATGSMDSVGGALYGASAGAGVRF